MSEKMAIAPEIQHGKRVIKGARVPLRRILGGLAGGMTEEEIMPEYELAEEDIRATLNYAKKWIESQPKIFEISTPFPPPLTGGWG